VIAFALASLVAGPLYGQATSLPSFTSAVSATSALLAAEFPEWRTQPTKLSAEVTMGTKEGVMQLRVSVQDGRPEEQMASRWGRWGTVGFLDGGVEFGRSGRVAGVVWRGRAVRSPELYQLRDLVDENQSWPDEQVAALLRDRGAQFGPDRKAAFIKRLRRGELQRIFGPFKVVRIRFEFRDPRVESVGETTAALEWVVDIETKTAQLTLRFEPFEGHLVSAAGLQYSDVPKGVKLPKR
jgi:hypothetical protein